MDSIEKRNMRNKISIILLLIGITYPSLGKQGESSMKWQFAISQHPMFLIIDQDTVCAERTPPWGAPDIETYIERLRRNLDALSKYPELKINYEISGVELEDLAGRAPDVIVTMRDWIKQGKLAFLNGTYAQPHLQNFGLESNVRQFQIGLGIFKQLLNYPVDTYAAQEVGITEQVPQLLTAYKYRFAVVPGFSWALTFLNNHEIVGYKDQLAFVNQEEFTQWIGLDSSNLPLYLSQTIPATTIEKTTEFEMQRDLFCGPPIKIDMPDMIEVDDKWIDDRLNTGEFVLLDKALRNRIQEAPPQSQSRFYTYWSYVEGIGAEALSRANMDAERDVLQAESLAAFLSTITQGKPTDYTRLWKTILKTQHHDAYWVGAPELRQKSIGWLKEVSQQAKQDTDTMLRSISDQVDLEKAAADKSILVYHSYPKSLETIVRVQIPVSITSTDELLLTDLKRKPIPVQIVPSLKEDTTEIIFNIKSNGTGYTTLPIQVKKNSMPVSKIKTDTSCTKITKPVVFENKYYRAKIRPDGLFEQLYCKETKKELLKTQTYFGNELRAKQDKVWITSRDKAVESTLVQGTIADLFIIRGTLTTGAKYQTEIWCYRELPWIDIEQQLEFDDCSLGDFWDDETKLNVYWPLLNTGEIFNGIAGGTVQAREHRPIFALNWVDMVSPKGSLAVVNHGTLKHWVKNNVLAMVLAWGQNSNDFSNRLHRYWSKPFDLRLKGTQVIRYSIYPHAGDWKTANIPDWAMAMTNPANAFFQDKSHSGKLPPELTLLQIKNENIIPSSIRYEKGKLICRFYEGHGKSVGSLNCITKGARNKSPVKDLSGKTINIIAPYKIGEVSFKK